MFIEFHSEWQTPLSTLAVSLYTGSSHIPSPTEILPELPNQVTELIILFSQILVEEATRKDPSSPRSSELFQVIHETVFPTTIDLLFTNQLYQSSLECLNSWIQYISVVEFNSTERHDITKPLDTLLDLIISEDSNISSKAIDVTIDILETKPSFFSKDLKNKISSIIFSPWCIHYLEECRNVEDYETFNNFARFVILFLEADVMGFNKNLMDDSKVEFLISLTDFPALPIEEELLSKDILEFWSELAETHLEDQDRVAVIFENDPQKIEGVNNKIYEIYTRVSLVFLKKMQIPKADFTSYKSQFMSYRRDIADFLDLIFPILKMPFYQYLTSSALDIVNQDISDVNGLEALLFAISTISGNFTESRLSPELLECLSKLLQEEVLKKVSSKVSDPGSIYLISTSIQLLSEVGFFYKVEQGVPFLPLVLEFLFACVMNSTSFELQASRAIAKIADDCRSSLITFLPTFETIVFNLIENSAVSAVVRERIVNSFASIVQANPDISAQEQHLKQTLTGIKLKITILIETESISTLESLDYLISLIKCVDEMGKGMQLPDELDDGDETDTPESFAIFSSVQEIVVSIISQVSLDKTRPILLQNFEIVEKCCDIFRRGLTESKSGPFTFDISVIIEYIVTKFPLCNPNALPNLFKLLETVIFTNYLKLTEASIHGICDVLILQNAELIRQDPDLLESSISMLQVIIEKKPSLLLYYSRFSSILDLCLLAISTKEKLVLKSASKFWSKLLVLKKGTRKDTEIVSELLYNGNLGITLTLTTLVSFLDTLRSNIEYFQEILKFLVLKHPLQSKDWFTRSFQEISGRRGREGQKELKNTDLFIKKMMATRGRGHEFAKVVKNFWLESNGLTNY